MRGDERHGLVEEFKAAFRRFPAGVALISAIGPNGPVGLTASSVASVSLKPVALAFSLSATTRSSRAVLAAETFVVHLLSARDVDVARAFADPNAPRFTAEQGWSTLPTGEPVLPSALVALRCRHLEAVPVGDSTVVVAEVLEIHPNRSAGPALAYYERAYRVVDDSTPSPRGQG